LGHSRETKLATVTLWKVLYGALFLVVVPALLVLWAFAASPNVGLPVYGSVPLGVSLSIAGLAMMLAAMFELWRFGGGLPMNAFPPPRLVARGTFLLLPHPIYTGFITLCLGVSMAARSPSGLWLVTPTAALACTCLVLGYEHPDLQRRFGHALHVLPPADDTAPSTLERIRFLLLCVVPWVVLYELTIRLPLRRTPFAFSFEEHLPVWPWTTPIYASTYVTVALAPWCARTKRDLRQLMMSAWTATLVVFPFYWLVPSSAPRRPMMSHDLMTSWLNFERTTYPPTAAFPSFHVLWAVFVARLYRPRLLGVAYVVAVAISCITTGMHYVADVLLALAIAPALSAPQKVWRLLRSSAQWLANSWREWRLGPLRLINHAFYAAIAAFAQVFIVTGALGRGYEWKVLVTVAAGLLGAAAWAQWIEGSSRLRRPFGFYGGLIAGGLACLFFQERWLLLAANCLAAPWMQAIGRLRCLVNGCCHGRPAAPEIGIRVTHPRSRVSHLAYLAGIPIHPTQLYSILTNTLLGLVLARLWFSACALSVIIGVYAIGNGAARFVEEAYRGEPQTPSILGLCLYQWMALGTAILGAVLTAVPSAPAPPWTPSLTGLCLGIAFGAIAGLALGVDFPESESMFARLT
jgi:protein-S-isoprenylcysteine O-methyltransferase Ste14